MHWTKTSSSLSETFSQPVYCMCEQWWVWQNCTFAKASQNLCHSHIHQAPFLNVTTHTGKLVFKFLINKLTECNIWHHLVSTYNIWVKHGFKIGLQNAGIKFLLNNGKRLCSAKDDTYLQLKNFIEIVLKLAIFLSLCKFIDPRSQRTT